VSLSNHRSIHPSLHVCLLRVCVCVCVSVCVCVYIYVCVCVCERWWLSGDVSVTMTTDQGQVIPVKLVDNHDGTYRVEFEATSVGVYNTSVTFAGQLTPASPYKITVQQPTAVDTSKVRVTDLPDSMSVLSSTHSTLYIVYTLHSTLYTIYSLLHTVPTAHCRALTLVYCGGALCCPQRRVSLALHVDAMETLSV